ncbi:MAG: 50S ribosomal protein L13 [Candidatus Brocadiaceae bacterium]|nr:50S ribosomal protein L13 [Candidatus Brocadiaceae bacterium]
MKTRFAHKEDYKDNRRWLHVDASDQVLGRLATRVAVALMGKDRPDYTPNVDTGAYVVVTSAERVRLTGRKMDQKVYRHHSGYPGGLKEVSVAEVLRKHPERVIKEAVRRMLPKSKLGDAMLTKLKVYAGPDHPHTYHKPQELPL